MMHISNLPEPSQLMETVSQQGYAIIENGLDQKAYDSMRSYWIQHFEKKQSNEMTVRGDILLGEKNFNSFDKNGFWHLYRNFEFLWNESYHECSKEVHLELHKYRNLMQGFDKNEGLLYQKNRYGIYLSTSHYPMSGFLEGHIDVHQDHPLIHYMIPLTFSGTDYKSGGMFVFNKNNELLNLDALVNPRSIIFFDGRLKHGVSKITTIDEKKIGRIATFAIPTHFVSQEKVPRILRPFLSSGGFQYYLKSQLLRAKKVFKS